MTDTTFKWPMIILTVAIGFHMMSCSRLMHESTLPSPVKPDMARVYFIFPTHSAMGVNEGAAYVTEETRLVGFITNRQAFHADVPPGRHLFMAILSNTEAVEIDAAAGKTYYVKVVSAPNPIPYGGPVVIVTPLVPGYGEWDMRHKWLAAVDFMAYDPVKGAKWERKYRERNQERLANIRSGEAGLKPVLPDQGE